MSSLASRVSSRRHRSAGPWSGRRSAPSTAQRHRTVPAWRRGGSAPPLRPASGGGQDLGKTQARFRMVGIGLHGGPGRPLAGLRIVEELPVPGQCQVDGRRRPCVPAPRSLPASSASAASARASCTGPSSNRPPASAFQRRSIDASAARMMSERGVAGSPVPSIVRSSWARLCSSADCSRDASIRNRQPVVTESLSDGSARLRYSGLAIPRATPDWTRCSAHSVSTANPWNSLQGNGRIQDRAACDPPERVTLGTSHEEGELASRTSRVRKSGAPDPGLRAEQERIAVGDGRVGSCLERRDERRQVVRVEHIVVRLDGKERGIHVGQEGAQVAVPAELPVVDGQLEPWVRQNGPACLDRGVGVDRLQCDAHPEVAEGLGLERGERVADERRRTVRRQAHGQEGHARISRASGVPDP